MARYIDADALIKRLGINKDCTECSYCTRKYYCSWNPDPGEICIAISEQPTVTINDHPNEIKVTNCHHIADDSKKGDLISRADAIDALAEYVHNVDKVMGTGRLSWDDCKDSATSVLEDVPSAQPNASENTCEITRKSNDLISRQDAIDALDKRFDSISMEQTTEILMLRKDLQKLPSVQPEREKGKWINHRCDDGHNIADCSVCGNPIQWFDPDPKPNYCPNCGAKMLKKGEDE